MMFKVTSCKDVLSIQEMCFSVFVRMQRLKVSLTKQKHGFPVISNLSFFLIDCNGRLWEKTIKIKELIARLVRWLLAMWHGCFVGNVDRSSDVWLIDTSLE